METVNQGKGGDPTKPWFVELVSGGGGQATVTTEEALNSIGANAGISLLVAAPTALITGVTAQRRNIAGVNNGPNPIFIGFDNNAALLAANGTPVPAGGSFEIESIDPDLVLYGISSVADQVTPLNTRISETGGTVSSGGGIIKVGFVALPGGNPNRVVVPFSEIAAGSTVVVSVRSAAGIPGVLEADPANYVNGVSFTIESTNPADLSTVNYVVI